MRWAIFLTVLLAAPAFADELPPDVQKALERVASGDAKGEEVLVAAKDAKGVAIKLEQLLGDAAHGKHPAAIHALARLLGAHPDLEVEIPAGSALLGEPGPCLLAGIKAIDELCGTRKDLVAKQRKAIFASLVGALDIARNRNVEEAAQSALQSLTGEKAGKTRAEWADLYVKEFRESIWIGEIGAEKEAAEKLLVELASAKPEERARLDAAIRDSTHRLRALDARVGGKVADALLDRLRSARGDELANLDAASAKKLLVVTAIIVDPRPESTSRAIVHLGGHAAIYKEGERVHDENGDPVKDLTVKKVAEGVVTFSLAGEELSVDLKTP